MSLCGVQTLPLTAQNLYSMPISTTGLTSRILSWLGESQGVFATQTVQTNANESADLLDVSESNPRHSKEMCPDSYLDFAAKHDNLTLATKEGITLTSVKNAITDAAHYVASRERKPVISVLSDFEGDRLRNGIHRSHKDYVATLNLRAVAQFRACRVQKPDMSKTSVPCKLQVKGGKTRCRRHAYCTLMQMENASKAAYEAEQEAKSRDVSAEGASGFEREAVDPR